MWDCRTREEILTLYPYLEDADVTQALTYAAWRTEEIDIPCGEDITRVLKRQNEALERGALVSIDQKRARVQVLPLYTNG